MVSLQGLILVVSDTPVGGQDGHGGVDREDRHDAVHRQHREQTLRRGNNLKGFDDFTSKKAQVKARIWL